MNNKEVFNLLTRYIILLLLPLNGLFIFYFIFTPLTVKPFFYFLHLFYPETTLLENNTILFKGYYAQIISSCVAGAAYYLLAILNLTTPMPIKKRIASLFFLFFSFMFLNILRIFSFTLLIEKGYNYFEAAHLFAWYFGSTLLVVFVWFVNVLIFQIKAIPIYTDFKNLIDDIKSSPEDSIRK